MIDRNSPSEKPEIKSLVQGITAVLVILLMWTGCRVDEPISVDSDRGHLVMLGGGSRPADVMKKIVSLSPDSTFLVVPMASSIADTIGWEHRDTLYKYGAKNVEIMMLEEGDTANAEIIEKFRNASGIWFSGGDQNRLMDYLGQGELKNAVIEAYNNGAVIAGTSAGTAVQSNVMMTGDERYPISEYIYFGQIRPGNAVTSPGIGLVSGMIVDQHFIKRRRNNRLITALFDHQDVRAAAGIDESTALHFRPDGWVDVIGVGQVMLYQKEQTEIKESGELYGATGLALHILPTGSRFYWNTNLHTASSIELPSAETE